MKKMFLLIVVPALLVVLGFGQEPATPSNTDQASIKGCLSAADGNYTVAEDGTTQIFKLSSNTVDLKAHVGHDVEVIGHETNMAASSAPPDNRVAVTAVNMISDHCVTAAAANTVAPAVVETTPPMNASAPAPDTIPTPAPATSTPFVSDPTSAQTASAPAEPASPPVTLMASAKPTKSTESLPATASPLPMLGLIGFGLVAVGLFIRRSRTNQS
jgi:uncharacterized protein with FMN-binding domain